MATGEPESITIVNLAHDIRQRRSIVTLVWDQPDKRIALPVPYGTSLDDLYGEAEKAVKAFAAEFASIRIRPVV
jgi:hypothetical protein